jgi:Arf-GAP/SH3 domain/ANK repeat/PH domain-containing protein
LLFQAIRLNNIPVVEELLQNNDSPNIIDERGNTPLHLASTLKYDDMVILLLKYHAEPNILGSEGEAALHIAAYNGSLTIVKALLKSKGES